MRTLAAVLAFGLLFPAVAEAQDAGAYVPANTSFVMRWKNPQATIDRAEAFMLRVGLAPPGSQKGFILQRMSAQSPALASIDLGQPIWIAGFGEIDDPKPMMLFTLGEGVNVETLRSTIEGARMERHGRIVAVMHESLPADLGKKKQRSSYRFASSSVAGKSNIAFDVVGESLQKLLNDSSGAQPELEGLEDLMSKFYEGMEGLTIGANLTDSALEATLGSVYGKTSIYAKSLTKVSNQKGSVVEGLPQGQYVVVGGGTASQLSEASLPLVQSMLQGIKPALARDPETAPMAAKIDRLAEILGESWGAAKRAHFGLEIPAGLESTRFVGYMDGDSAKMNKSFKDLFAWLNELVAEAAKGAGKAPPLKVVEAKATKQAGVSFTTFGLELPKEAGANMRAELGPYARLFEQKLQLGALNASKSVLVWASDAEFVQSAVAAAKKPRPLVSSNARLKATSDALPQARFSEAYVDLGPLAAAIVAMKIPAMASTVRNALGSVPPIGYSLSKAGPSEIQTDFFVPLQLVEAGIGLAQLFQGG